MSKDAGNKATELALAAYANLLRASETVVGLLSRQLDSFGLSMNQFRVLALVRRGPVTQGAICEELLCGSSEMTFLARSLERRGLIRRFVPETDKRYKMIRLTASGRKLMAEVFPAHVNLVRAQMGALSIRDLEALRRMCGRLGRVDPVRFARGEG